MARAVEVIAAGAIGLSATALIGYLVAAVVAVVATSRVARRQRASERDLDQLLDEVLGPRTGEVAPGVARPR